MGQVIATIPVKPPLGVTLTVDVPLVPPAVAVAKVGAGVNENEPPPPVVPVKLKFKMLFPPKACGFASGGPKELTMM